MKMGQIPVSEMFYEIKDRVMYFVQNCDNNINFFPEYVKGCNVNMYSTSETYLSNMLQPTLVIFRYLSIAVDSESSISDAGYDSIYAIICCMVMAS
jgi:hypothetical protein